MENTYSLERLLKEIPEKVSLVDCMGLLQEEASELIKACSKMNRVEGNGFPTPVTRNEAYYNLLEEIADVMVCIDHVIERMALDKDYESELSIIHDYIRDMEYFKTVRMAERLGIFEEDKSDA